jgi:hypothetical protein
MVMVLVGCIEGDSTSAIGSAVVKGGRRSRRGMLDKAWQKE